MIKRLKTNHLIPIITALITVLALCTQPTLASGEDDYRVFAKFTFSVNLFGTEDSFFANIDRLTKHLGSACMIPTGFAYDLVPSKDPLSYDFYVVLPPILDVEHTFSLSCNKNHLEKARVMASDFDPFVMKTLSVQLLTYPLHCVSSGDHPTLEDDDSGSNNTNNNNNNNNNNVDPYNHRDEDDNHSFGKTQHDTHLCGSDCPPCGELSPCQVDQDCGVNSYCVEMFTAEDSYEGRHYCSIVYQFDGSVSQLREAANSSSKLLTSLILIVIMTCISMLTMFTYNFRENDRKF